MARLPFSPFFDFGRSPWRKNAVGRRLPVQTAGFADLPFLLGSMAEREGSFLKGCFPRGLRGGKSPDRRARQYAGWVAFFRLGVLRPHRESSCAINSSRRFFEPAFLSSLRSFLNSCRPSTFEGSRQRRFAILSSGQSTRLTLLHQPVLSGQPREELSATKARRLYKVLPVRSCQQVVILNGI